MSIYGHHRKPFIKPFMQKEEKATEKKKGILVRVMPKAYLVLLREAANESVKRGKAVTVASLCLEIVMAWVDGRKK